MTTDSRPLLPQRIIRPYRNISVADRIWLATISIANGLPFAFIFLLLVMFKRMGLNNSTVTFNISWLCLPFVLRPFCHLLFKRVGWSKEVWILTSELVIAVSLLLMSEALGSDYWFQYIMLLLFALSIATTIHNVVAESKYKYITINPYPVMLRPMFVVYHSLALLFGLGVLSMFAGNIEVVTRNVSYAWTFVLRLAAGVYAVLWLYHLIRIWRTDTDDAPTIDMGSIATWREMMHTLRLFFGKKSVTIGPVFFLLYLLPQGFTAMVMSLFLIDSAHRGGLGLSPQEYALTQGTVGVIGMSVGSLLCIRLLKRYRTAKSIIPMSFANLLPALMGMTLSHLASASLLAVNVCMFVGNMGLGFSITACVSFLAYYSCGKYKHVFYSIGIALFFFSCAASSIYSGAMQRYYGYPVYFVLAFAFSFISVIVAVVLKRICFRRN